MTTTTNNVSRSRLRTGSALRALALTGAGLMIGAGFAAPAFAQDNTPAQTNATPAADQNAPAQENSAQTSQDIVVTGTIFRNPSAATASPVTTLTSEDLADRGVTTVAQAVQTLSANNAGTAATSWSSFGFATGATAPSLRGLNDAYTLTIFDGLRSAVYPLADDGSRNFVDINTIPDSIVDRVQVLQDGASATYGADAIAGVVNVIVKKEITGLHLNASSGISQRGDAGEQRLDGTVGYGKLDEQGWNLWVNGEYQKNDELWSRDRGYPFNTADLSKICGSSLGGGGYSPGQTTCMFNGVSNGIQADGSYAGIGNTIVPAFRPYNSGTYTSVDPGTGLPVDFAPGTVVMGPYQLAGGCGTLNPVALNAGQQGTAAPTWTQNDDGTYSFNKIGYTGVAYGAQQCQQDLVHDYQQYNPKIERLGANARFTANIGSRAQAYVMFNYYRTKTDNFGTPRSFAGRTAAGGTGFTLSPLLLPVYVCPLNGANAVLNGSTISAPGGCTAANGTRNPNNPYATGATPYQAQIVGLMPEPTETRTNAQTWRVTAGIDGSFGDNWDYSVDYTASRVNLDVDQLGYINAQHLMNVIADGSFNFLDPGANSREALDYVAPPNHNHSYSVLQEVQGTLSKELFQLPGGALQLAIGGSYRYEAVRNPSANPANEVNPADRYYGINAVGVNGSRDVKSGFFELDAPVLNSLDLKASGRYDKYSSGQSNFSPKFEAQFTPIRQLKLRGTYSKGFRIASFNEAYGLPTTGYVTVQIDCKTYASFCNAHGNNNYVNGGYSYGLTSVGNPNLKPEKSRSFTLGAVLMPTSRFTFTIDYWNIKIKDLITGADTSAVFGDYYSNNGVVNIPGITVIPDTPDPDHPDALPRLGFIQYSFQNADSSRASGLDFTGTARVPLGSHIRWTSSVNASYLIHLGQTIGGTYQQYDGTLGPCNVTSCSGAPKWRGNWQNTFEFGDSTTLSATAYYTSGYDLEATDLGGVIGDCQGSVGAAVVDYQDGVTPVSCHTKSFISVDLHASQKVADHFTLYADMLNVFDVKPPFDPSAAYSIYQFNPAWADSGFIGRYFRIGAKVDF